MVDFDSAIPRFESWRPQPASPVSATSFPGVGEVATFPRVTLSQPRLWRGKRVEFQRIRRLFGACLSWRFSNFRFRRAETGSMTARGQFAFPRLLPGGAGVSRAGRVRPPAPEVRRQGPKSSKSQMLRGRVLFSSG